MADFADEMKTPETTKVTVESAHDVAPEPEPTPVATPAANKAITLQPAGEASMHAIQDDLLSQLPKGTKQLIEGGLQRVRNNSRSRVHPLGGAMKPFNNRISPVAWALNQAISAVEGGGNRVNIPQLGVLMQYLSEVWAQEFVVPLMKQMPRALYDQLDPQVRDVLQPYFDDAQAQLRIGESD